MLRRGSGKKAAAPKPAKAPKSKAKVPGVAVAKAKNDAFTAMLGVAVGAMLIACLMLFLEWRRFG